MNMTQIKNDPDYVKASSPDKRKRGKKALTALAVVIIIIAVFICITAVLTDISIKSSLERAKSYPDAGCRQLKLRNYENGCWNIYPEDGLKIMQLTDIHIGGGWMSKSKDCMAINAVAAMITAEKPDLVIVTGDIAYPSLLQAGTLNNKSGAEIFSELMESLGVYWTLALGNHDIDAYSKYSYEEITGLYSSDKYPHCLFQAGPENIDGSGNQVLNIINPDGIISRSLIILDSHSCIDRNIVSNLIGVGSKYDNIHENQIEWYKSTVSDIIALNKKTLEDADYIKAEKYSDYTECVPTSVFLHIPLAEYKEAWGEYAANGYKDTENVRLIYGVSEEKGEAVCCGINPDGMFEAIEALGSTDSVFCGHDHQNNYSLDYKGIRLTYSMSIDYLAYFGIDKLGTQRGCTVINIDKSGKADFYSENYYQDKYVSEYPKENVK